MAKLNDQWFAATHGMEDGPIIPIGYDDSPPNARIGIYPPRLLCPVCGFDYVHPAAVECLPAGESKSHVIITNDGLAVRPNSGVYGYGRGVAIILRFFCESGHEFSYALQFHKGNTLIEREVWKSPDIDAMRTIWRD